MAEDCVFCKIVAGELPSDRLYQDSGVTAFRDINPVGPVHILIVPNRHISGVGELEAGDEEVVGSLFICARQLAELEGLRDSGYRLIINNGPDGGQVVYHLHVHLIGGRKMRYPMG